MRKPGSHRFRQAPLASFESFLSLETEEREMFGPAASNLNLRGETGQATVRNNTDNRSSGLDVVSLASSLASDLAHLVESMNLADRPGQASNANRNRPLTAR